MKFRIAVCVVVVAAICGAAGYCLWAQNESTATSNLKKQTGEMAGALKDYATEKKADFQSRMEKRMKDLEPKIEELKKKAQDTAAQGSAKFKAQLKDLEAKHSDVRKRLDRITSSTKDAWTDMKGGMEKAMDDLGAAYEKAKKRYQ